MRNLTRKIILSSIFIVLLPTISVAQSAHSLPEPQMDDGSSSGVPPPPGLILPIDTNIGWLLIAGLGLGICFVCSRAKTT